MENCEIVLPASCQFVSLKELPSLIANALFPDQTSDDSHCVVIIGKTALENSPAVIPLSDDDKHLLVQIWRDLPQFEDRIPLGAWQEYLRAFDDSPIKPTWSVSLLPCIDGVEGNHLRHEAILGFEKALMLEIQSGRLPVFNPRNYSEIALPIEGDRLRNALVHVDGIRNYVKNKPIRLRVETASVIAQSDTPSVSHPSIEKLNCFEIGHSKVAELVHVVTAEAALPKELELKPLQRQRHQEQEILRVIKELGHSAKALPKREQGKSGIKREVRNFLPFSNKVLDNAWQRLRDDGEIQDAP